MRAKLGEWLARLDRHALVHRLLLLLLPRAIRRRFVAPADALEATFELAIRDPRGGESARFALAVTGPSCTVRAGAPARAGARATLGSDDLIRLASGAATWPALLSTGHFELSGDPFLALRFASLFRLPFELDPPPVQ